MNKEENKMSNQNSTKGLALWQKIGYGVGDAGSTFCWTFIFCQLLPCGVFHVSLVQRAGEL